MSDQNEPKRLEVTLQPYQPRPKGRPRRKAAGAKLQSQMTWTEKWHDRRDRLFAVLPTRIRILDKAFDGLIKVSSRERYEITDEEIENLVAHLQVWLDTVEESFKARKEIYPSELPPVSLDHDLAPPTNTLPPPTGLEEIW